MGEFLSKQTIHSVDVSGDNSYVLVLNGVRINLSAILHNITENIIKENQKVMIKTMVITNIITVILTILIMSIRFSYFMKYYQEYLELFMDRIVIQMHHIKVIIQNNTTKRNQCEISTTKT
jgi:hypothetical protein